MNISEIQSPKLEGDKLEQLFRTQKIIEQQFANIEGFPSRLIFGKQKNLHLPETCHHITNNILWRMTQEIHEAVIALRNAKTWRQTTYFTDINEYYDEIADIFIYFINLCFASGISPSELTEMTLKKMVINRRRIESKY